MSSNLICLAKKSEGNLATESNTLPADHTGLLYRPHQSLKALVAVRLQRVQVQMQMQLQVQPQY